MRKMESYKTLFIGIVSFFELTRWFRPCHGVNGISSTLSNLLGRALQTNNSSRILYEGGEVCTMVCTSSLYLGVGRNCQFRH